MVAPMAILHPLSTSRKALRRRPILRDAACRGKPGGSRGGVALRLAYRLIRDGAVGRTGRAFETPAAGGETAGRAGTWGDSSGPAIASSGSRRFRWAGVSSTEVAGSLS